MLPIARALHDVVDAVVAGHSHAGMAHFVDGIPVIRVRLWPSVCPRRSGLPQHQVGFVLDKPKTVVHRPKELCSVQVPIEDEPLPPAPDKPNGDGAGNRGVPPQRVWHCDAKMLGGKELKPATYEGLPVVPSEPVQLALAPHIAKAAENAARRFG